MPEIKDNSPNFDIRDYQLNQDQEAAVAGRLALVNEIATDYLDRGLGVDDLVQAGISGLKLAVVLAEKEPSGDPDRYAAHWVRRGILGAIAAQQAFDDFIGGFRQQNSNRRPNLAEIRDYGQVESERMDRGVGAYVRMADDFVEAFDDEFGHLPTPAEAAAFGRIRRQQLDRRLGDYISKYLLGDPSEKAAEFEPGPLYVPDDWLAGLSSEQRNALILRYGLDGSGIREVSDVGHQLKLVPKTKQAGKVIKQALADLAQTSGINSRHLLVYPDLFLGMPDLDRRVLAMRLGVGDYRPMEVKEVAAEINLSVEAVRSAEWRAIRCHLNHNSDPNLIAAPVGGVSS